MAPTTWVESVRCRPRALSSPCVLCQRQQGIQEQGLRLPSDQPGAELAQDGMVEAGIGQLQAQDVFPINAATDRIRGLAIGEAFGKLQDAWPAPGGQALLPVGRAWGRGR